jgi:hypothetical protein
MFCLAWPRVVEDPQVNKQAEVVCTNPFPRHLVLLEVHDADRPYLYRTSGRGPSQMSSRVGASVPESQDDRISGNDEILDVHMEIRKGLVVAADWFGSGR